MSTYKQIHTIFVSLWFFIYDLLLLQRSPNSWYNYMNVITCGFCSIPHIQSVPKQVQVSWLLLFWAGIGLYGSTLQACAKQFPSMRHYSMPIIILDLASLTTALALEIGILKWLEFAFFWVLIPFYVDIMRFFFPFVRRCVCSSLLFFFLVGLLSFLFTIFPLYTQMQAICRL